MFEFSTSTHLLHLITHSITEFSVLVAIVSPVCPITALLCLAVPPCRTVLHIWPGAVGAFQLHRTALKVPQHLHTLSRRPLNNTRAYIARTFHRAVAAGQSPPDQTQPGWKSAFISNDKAYIRRFRRLQNILTITVTTVRVQFWICIDLTKSSLTWVQFPPAPVPPAAPCPRTGVKTRCNSLIAVWHITRPQISL